jgi:hypothetical protein
MTSDLTLLHYTGY